MGSISFDEEGAGGNAKLRDPAFSTSSKERKAEDTASGSLRSVEEPNGKDAAYDEKSRSEAKQQINEIGTSAIDDEKKKKRDAAYDEKLTSEAKQHINEISASAIDDEKKKKLRKRKRKGAQCCTSETGGTKDRWETMFGRLLEFKREKGHCLVPNRYSEDRSLGSWVSTQRRQFKILTSGSSESTPMTPERASRLMSIGFQWVAKDPRHVPWETRFQELCEFKRKHGHCLVPVGYTENSKLSHWVSTQRQDKKLMNEGRSTRLTPERVKALDEIGFVWEAQRGGSRKKKSHSPSPAQQDVNFLTPAPVAQGNAMQGSLPSATGGFQSLPVGAASLLPTDPSHLRASLPASARMPEDTTELEGMIAHRRDDAAMYRATEAASRAREQAMIFDAIIAREHALRHQHGLLLASQLHSLGQSSSTSGLLQPTSGSLLGYQGALLGGTRPLTMLTHGGLLPENRNRFSRVPDALQATPLEHERMLALSSSFLPRRNEGDPGGDDFAAEDTNTQNKRRRYG